MSSLRGMIFVLYFSSVWNNVCVLENGLARSPPMGWMSWGYYMCGVDCERNPDKCLDETLILSVADTFYNEGYQEAGFEYIIIDDCWSEKNRDEHGRLLPDAKRFPHGMKYIADYIHAKGLKFGMYTNVAAITCMRYPGSRDHFRVDAMTFAEWGVDYLKVDGCYVGEDFLNQGPGSTKPATIPKSQLKYLSFVVQGNGRSRQKYNYWNARNIANDPRVNFKRKTLLLAIGYLDSPSFPISAMFANEYEDLGYNVIIVDNQRFSTVHYHLASRLMRPVGKHVAEVLTQLTQSGLDPSKLELLGFSLGGQTVSYVAKNYQQMTGRNVSNIVALEPSGPCFRTLGKGDRLDASNADFVQVLHTNIDGYGMATPMGHVDFYINGGEYQPSDLNLYPCTTTCSHFRVLALWAIALRHPGKFLGIKCKNIQQARDGKCFENCPVETNVMDLTIDKKKHGVYFVSTSKEYPYYLGSKGLRDEYLYWKRITNVNDGNDVELYT